MLNETCYSSWLVVLVGVNLRDATLFMAVPALIQ